METYLVLAALIQQLGLSAYLTGPSPPLWIDGMP